MTPRFSIVIPTYNRASSVLQTLQSCFEQDVSDFEIIVIDDGSTDNTLDVLSTVSDSRVRVISQPNAGPAAARNHGMRESQGQYIAFLDSDDRWYPDFLTQANAVINAHGQVLVYGQIIVDRGVGRYWIKPDRAIEPEEAIYDYLYVHNAFIQTSTMVIPRALASDVHWDESLTFGDNDQFAIDCWQTGIAFHMIETPATHYADIISSDALSQLPLYDAKSTRYTNFFRWMATHRNNMSTTAWAGYQARFESVALARSAPLDSMRLLLKARQAGALSLRGVLRQSIQNLLPRPYRKLVDQYVRLRGMTLEQTRE